MAIRFYDEAIANKINEWFPSEYGIQVLKPDEVTRLYENKLDQNKDKPIKFPFVALSRDTTVELKLATQNPQTWGGKLISSDGNESLVMRNIDMSLKYQLDIYAAKAVQADELLREFVYKIMSDNQIVIEVPYNGQHIRHTSVMTLSNQIEDTSSIGERLFPGQFTRWTLHISINDAHLFSISRKSVIKIGNVGMFYNEVDDKFEYEEGKGEE